MDEDSGLEGDGRRALPVKKTSHYVEIHRVNDFLVGHIGQVSYKPAEEAGADIGNLHSSRLTDQCESTARSSFIACPQAYE